MRRRFILTKIFDVALGRYEDRDKLLELIEDKILDNVEVGDTIAGTGGLRGEKNESRKINKD